MVICLLIGASLLLQAPSTPVTYRTRAKLIPAVLQELSAQTHVSLKADAVAGKEVVVVAVKELPLSTLMEKLASVTSCKWVNFGDGYTLKPDIALRDKEAKHDLAAKVEEIREAIKKGPDPQETVITSPEDDSELASAILDMNLKEAQVLLKAMDPEQLAELDPTKHIVWASNNPTRYQWQLNDKAVSVLSDWIAKHDEAVSQAIDEQKQSGENGAGQPLVPSSKLIGRSVSKVLVSADALLGGGGEVRVEFLDGNDGPLLSGSARYGDSGEWQPKNEQGIPLKLTDDERILLTQVPRLVSAEPFKVEIPPRLLKLLRHPEQTDPLAPIVSQGLFQIAEAENRQLIADVPDSAFQFGLTFEGHSTLEGFHRDLKERCRIAESDDGRVLTIQPGRPSFDRSRRADRQALRNLFAEGEKHGIVGLDALSEFALRSPSPAVNDIVETYLVVAGSGVDTRGTTGSWPGLRFFGSLEAERRTILRAGGPVPVSSLSDTQRSYLETTVFAGRADLGQAGNEDLLCLDGDDLLGVMSKVCLEPTELLPYGIMASSISFSDLNLSGWIAVCFGPHLPWIVSSRS